MKFYVLIFAIFSYSDLLAQKLVTIDLKKSCSYYGEKLPSRIYEFEGDSVTIILAIKRITNTVGLRPNFRIKQASVPNAMAIMDTDGKGRLILYSENFFINISDITKGEWAKFAVLAHEVGHHLNNHVLSVGVSRPELELEADEFSGFICGSLGSELLEAQSAINIFNNDYDTTTHPNKLARLEAIAIGWKKGNTKRLSGSIEEFIVPKAINNDVLDTQPIVNLPALYDAILSDKDTISYTENKLRIEVGGVSSTRIAEPTSNPQYNLKAQVYYGITYMFENKVEVGLMPTFNFYNITDTSYNSSNTLYSRLKLSFNLSLLYYFKRFSSLNVNYFGGLNVGFDPSIGNAQMYFGVFLPYNRTFATQVKLGIIKFGPPADFGNKLQNSLSYTGIFLGVNFRMNMFRKKSIFANK
ncbi:M48 family metalloprotease [Spirosoma pollinicola]|uniref:Uncharacterized protein n=1 Tax=Spirosoma pollinicola TaxID=2057025 RepID=A0A2K8Z6R0_9BACT|nr:hypothetical protein [Spirosoma pollinicola]AUD05562.1 hypothetical protein CWM47_29190 [Spirosoma pollinicola]